MRGWTYTDCGAGVSRWEFRAPGVSVQLWAFPGCSSSAEASLISYQLDAQQPEGARAVFNASAAPPIGGTPPPSIAWWANTIRASAVELAFVELAAARVGIHPPMAGVLR